MTCPCYLSHVPALGSNYLCLVIHLVSLGHLIKSAKYSTLQPRCLKLSKGDFLVAIVLCELREGLPALYGRFSQCNCGLSIEGFSEITISRMVAISKSDFLQSDSDMSNIVKLLYECECGGWNLWK